MEGGGQFKGINYFTGRKIYLTKEEEKIIKKQHWIFFKTIFWIFGIFIGLFILFLFFIV